MDVTICRNEPLVNLSAFKEGMGEGVAAERARIVKMLRSDVFENEARGEWVRRDISLFEAIADLIEQGDKG